MVKERTYGFPALASAMKWIHGDNQEVTQAITCSREADYAGVSAINAGYADTDQLTSTRESQCLSLYVAATSWLNLSVTHQDKTDPSTPNLLFSFMFL